MIFKGFESTRSDNFNVHVDFPVVLLKATLDIEENICREEWAYIVVETGITPHVSSDDEKNIESRLFFHQLIDWNSHRLRHALGNTKRSHNSDSLEFTIEKLRIFQKFPKKLMDCLGTFCSINDID